MYLLTIALFLTIALSSCANVYRGMDLTIQKYSNEQETGALDISYVYDVQWLSWNKRYARKEHKFRLAAVGIKVKNNGNKPIVLTKGNLLTYANGNRKLYLTPEIYAANIKQSIYIYLLYTVLGIGFEGYERNTSTSQTYWHWVLASPALVNMSVAAYANWHHKDTMKATSIFGKKIEPGKTLYGTILIRLNNFEPLIFELSDTYFYEN